jgi:hypothetical protein
MDKVRGYVDGDIGGRLQQREQAGRLGAIAGAQVDQRAAATDGFQQLGAVPFEDGGFGTGGVIFGQFADGFEQLAAQRVLQELGRDERIGCVQSGRQFGRYCRRCQRRALGGQAIGACHRGPCLRRLAFLLS